jgi:hypothetical protein
LVFFFNITKAIRFAGGLGTVQNVFLTLAAIACSGLAVLVLIFPKDRTALRYVSIFWVGLFTWYAWWSLATPFRPHEFYSFSAQENEAYYHRHLLIAGLIFAFLCVWFLSVILLSRHRFERVAASAS